jgi:hypothetical protein
MATAKESVEITRKVDQLNKVRRAWNPDRGYVIVGFDDILAMGRVVEMMEENDFRPFDIDDSWLVDGKEVHTIHFCHESESEHWIDPKV